jgi:hypothetical protein
MKQLVVSLGVVGLLLTASPAMAQRGPACTTVACDLQADWAGNTDGLMGIANAMPDAEFGFKPTPAQQSFAERLMHVVTIDVKLLSTLGGKTPAPNINAKASSKADVLAAMKEWSAYGAAVLKEFNDHGPDDQPHAGGLLRHQPRPGHLRSACRLSAAEGRDAAEKQSSLIRSIALVANRGEKQPRCRRSQSRRQS